MIGCTGPPALQGIPLTRRARLLERDRRTNCGLPLARPPPGRNGAGAPTRLRQEPRGLGGQEAGGPGRTTAGRDCPDAAPTWHLPWRRRQRTGRGRTPGFTNATTLPLPSPSTAPVRSGMVPQCGQEPGTWGDTVPTSRWPWASDGPSAERRIVGPCRHWRPRGRSVGAGRAGVAVGGSPSVPYTLKAGRQCSPARLCVVSWAGTVGLIASGARAARLRRLRGHQAWRS